MEIKVPNITIVKKLLIVLTDWTTGVQVEELIKAYDDRLCQRAVSRYIDRVLNCIRKYVFVTKFATLYIVMQFLKVAWDSISKPKTQ